MSNLEAVSSLSRENFKTHFGEEKLKELFFGVDILGLGYWSLTANFVGLFQGFMEQYETAAPRPGRTLVPPDSNKLTAG